MDQNGIQAFIDSFDTTLTSTCNHKYYTAGRRQFPTANSIFLWNPFLGTEIHLEESSQWSQNQPDFNDGKENCVETRYGMFLNDIPCDIEICMICETKPFN